LHTPRLGTTKTVRDGTPAHLWVARLLLLFALLGLVSFPFVDAAAHEHMASHPHGHELSELLGEIPHPGHESDGIDDFHAAAHHLGAMADQIVRLAGAGARDVTRVRDALPPTADDGTAGRTVPPPLRPPAA
jgi:hypothetical protein